MWALRKFFPAETPLAALTEKKCERRYQELTETLSVDSHRNLLAEAKTFVRWIVKQRYLPKSPIEHIEGVFRWR
jgi:hypothetical protein